MNRTACLNARAQMRNDSQRNTLDQLARLPLTVELLESCRRDGRADPDPVRADASTLLWFTRQLEHVMAQAEKEEFPELKMANGEIVPIDNSIPDGAETWTYFMFSGTAIAQFSSGYSNGEFPLVTLKGAKVNGNVEPMENGYAWSTRDVRNAQFTGFGLETELSSFARRAHDQLLNDTGLFGREDLGLPGFINHPNITIRDAADNGAGSTFWADKTPDQILEDFNLAINTVNEITFGIETVNRVLLPRREWLRIKTLRLGPGDGTLMLIDALKAAHDGVEFGVLNELGASSSRGNLDEDALICYTANNKNKISLQQPMPFRQHPVQQENLMFKVPCESSVGGIKLTAPLSVLRMDGIGAS